MLLFVNVVCGMCWMREGVVLENVCKLLLERLGFFSACYGVCLGIWI